MKEADWAAAASKIDVEDLVKRTRRQGVTAYVEYDYFSHYGRIKIPSAEFYVSVLGTYPMFSLYEISGHSLYLFKKGERRKFLGRAPIDPKRALAKALIVAFAAVKVKLSEKNLPRYLKQK